MRLKGFIMSKKVKMEISQVRKGGLQPWFAAPPPDVRKVCDLPVALKHSFGAMPQVFWLFNMESIR
jgi:hypothetical protein